MREGDEAHPGGALPLLPRDRPRPAWSVVCRPAPLPLPGVALRAGAPGSPQLDRWRPSACREAPERRHGDAGPREARHRPRLPGPPHPGEPRLHKPTPARQPGPRGRGPAREPPPGQGGAEGVGRRQATIVGPRNAVGAPVGLPREDTDGWGADARQLEAAPHRVGQATPQHSASTPIKVRPRSTRWVRRTIGCSQTQQRHDLVLGRCINRHALGRAGGHGINSSENLLRVI